MIEARELTKRYGDKTVVDALSFTVKPGEVTGFLGPNGAGKSTTMRMIIGLDDPRLRALSEREHEVLVAIGKGWTNTEIAERLVLTESTVKKPVGRVLAKIGARDRIQAVILAYDAGLVRPHG